MLIPHIAGGKLTTHGHTVHYTDIEGNSHAAIITNIFAHPGTGSTHADLHVFHRETGTGKSVKGVPHGDGEPHTWAHLPY